MATNYKTQYPDFSDAGQAAQYWIGIPTGQESLNLEDAYKATWILAGFAGNYLPGQGGSPLQPAKEDKPLEKFQALCHTLHNHEKATPEHLRLAGVYAAPQGFDWVTFAQLAIQILEIIAARGV